jgi:hypothetical protein
MKYIVRQGKQTISPSPFLTYQQAQSWAISYLQSDKVSSLPKAARERLQLVIEEIA